MASDVIKPYRVVDSGKVLSDIIAHTNEQQYLGMGCDYQYGGTSKIVAAGLFDYQDLLAQLAALPQVEFVTHHDLLTQPCPADRVRISIRHDIDGDIVAAVKQAEVEQDLGIASTWCVLHTAPYYGTFESGVFHRHCCTGHLYRRLQELGHEVSLHTDPLMIYQTHGMDGAAAVVEELAWLRSLGLKVTGTAAHNSKPVYGAWNYEIFKGRYDGGARPPADDVKDHVVHNGRWTPLRVLDEKELGLVYEANDVFWQKHAPLEYGATRFVTLWRWNRHLRHIRENPHAPETEFVDQQRVLADIAAMDPGRFVVLVVHPCYYGSRTARDRSPVLQVDRISTIQNETLGWHTYDPLQVQCCAGRYEGTQTFQAINKPNEAGMLDLPWPTAVRAPEELAVVLLGSANLDGRTLPIPLHAHVRLAKLIEAHSDRSVRIAKLAFPGMGPGRLWSWYERTKAVLQPDVVILGVAASAVGLEETEQWARSTGVSPQYPAGDYLSWDAQSGQVRVVPYSPAWRSHRRDPQPSCDHVVPPRSLAGFQSFKACVRYLIDAVRADGARPFLLLEDGVDSPSACASSGEAVSLLRELAEELSATLIDPAERLNDNGGSVMCHRGDVRWSATGHRMASEAIFVELKRQGLV